MSLRWSSYVAPKPKRGSKTQNGRFRYIIALRLKKVCYQVSLCENCQRQSCKALSGSTILTAEVCHVVERHSMHFCLYADDSQIYTSVAVSDATSAVHRLAVCIADVNNWMSASRLYVSIRPRRRLCGWVLGICSNKLTSVTSLCCLPPSESCSRRVTLVSY